MEIVGYHATKEINAVNIENHGFISSGSNNWLGAGIYFWGDLGAVVDGLETARWWCDMKNLHPAVIFVATIFSDKFFDAIENVEHKKYYNLIRKRIIEKDRNKILSDKEYVNGVFVLLSEYYDAFRFFIKGDKLTGVNAADRIISDLQVQICVQNNACIKDKKRIA